MRAERTTMYVVDRDNKEIWSKVSEGIGQVRLPMGHGISGRVAETGEIINVADAWELPYFDRSYDLKNNFRTQAVLCVPIMSRSREIIGVIQVINKINGYCFDAEDEVFLKGLTSQVAIALENSLLVDEIFISFHSSISTLSAVVDAKHQFTAGHSERVRDYSLIIAEQMQLPKEETEILKYAALLHDIGKIGIRDDVLTKNGDFSPTDWEEMKTHPTKTKAILDKFHFPRSLVQVPDVACHHHEKMNGTGYPNGLTGDKLPRGSKIIAVADVFDALTSRRDYPKYTAGLILKSEPMPLGRAIDILKEQAGTKFDPQIVAAFLQALPQALLLHRGKHFPPAYVDPTIRLMQPELLP
jgi:HD-GYP domain-containing protein (c-di-GMP phosphodiesterase class II)